MAPEDRLRSVHHYKNDTNVLILTPDVGGFGLNLQWTTHIYMHSLSWNAATEMQCIARAHRIGCTNTVSVTRFVLEKTIDFHILELQETKMDVAAKLLGDTRIKQSLGVPLSFEKLESLFA